MPVLQFKGKTFVQNHHLMLEHHQLVPDAALSLTDAPGLNDNLVIQGDNLLTLKALMPSFAGRVKCIYIDPPYNTGNENWVYNDNVNSPEHKEWFRKVVSRDDLTRHDKWLCMMLPRLKLLRELLRDDGAIFISIDDNEVHHLRALMDELFGEENFIATIIWQKNYSPKNTAQFFSEDHDYIVVYAKDLLQFELNLLPRTEEQDAAYQNPDNDPRGLWKTSDLSARNPYSLGTYPITTPSGRTISGPPKGRYWTISQERFHKLDADNRIWWGKDGNAIPQTKRFLSEVKAGVVSQTLWFYKDVGHTQDAKKELISIFDFENSDDVFITPKPTALIKRILQIATDTNDIILDSFAGSGTTGQAVLALNAEDGGNRRFILIEQEEYADTLTAERVRRVISGVPGAKDAGLREGYGGSFTYARLGAALAERGILDGSAMPSYDELARYVFFTTTGEQWDATQQDAQRNYLGESRDYRVYMLYTPDPVALRRTALTLDLARELGTHGGKPTLVIAPYKLVDDDTLRDSNVAFCQLPFEIYRFRI